MLFLIERKYWVVKQNNKKLLLFQKYKKNIFTLKKRGFELFEEKKNLYNKRLKFSFLIGKGIYKYKGKFLKDRFCFYKKQKRKLNFNRFSNFIYNYSINRKKSRIKNLFFNNRFFKGYYQYKLKNILFIYRKIREGGLNDSILDKFLLLNNYFFYNKNKIFFNYSFFINNIYNYKYIRKEVFKFKVLYKIKNSRVFIRKVKNFLLKFRNNYEKLLLGYLESSLLFIVYRLKLGGSIYVSDQLIKHGFFEVDRNVKLNSFFNVSLNNIVGLISSYFLYLKDRKIFLFFESYIKWFSNYIFWKKNSYLNIKDLVLLYISYVVLYSDCRIIYLVCYYSSVNKFLDYFNYFSNLNYKLDNIFDFTSFFDNYGYFYDFFFEYNFFFDSILKIGYSFFIPLYRILFQDYLFVNNKLSFSTNPNYNYKFFFKIFNNLNPVIDFFSLKKKLFFLSSKNRKLYSIFDVFYKLKEFLGGFNSILDNKRVLGDCFISCLRNNDVFIIIKKLNLFFYSELVNYIKNNYSISFIERKKRQFFLYNRKFKVNLFFRFNIRNYTNIFFKYKKIFVKIFKNWEYKKRKFIGVDSSICKVYSNSEFDSFFKKKLSCIIGSDFNFITLINNLDKELILNKYILQSKIRREMKNSFEKGFFFYRFFTSLFKYFFFNIIKKQKDNIFSFNFIFNNNIFIYNKYDIEIFFDNLLFCSKITKFFFVIKKENNLNCFLESCNNKREKLVWKKKIEKDLFFHENIVFNNIFSFDFFLFNFFSFKEDSLFINNINMNFCKFYNNFYYFDYGNSFFFYTVYNNIKYYLYRRNNIWDLIYINNRVNKVLFKDSVYFIKNKKCKSNFYYRESFFFFKRYFKYLKLKSFFFYCFFSRLSFFGCLLYYKIFSFFFFFNINSRYNDKKYSLLRILSKNLFFIKNNDLFLYRYYKKNSYSFVKRRKINVIKKEKIKGYRFFYNVISNFIGLDNGFYSILKKEDYIKSVFDNVVLKKMSLFFYIQKQSFINKFYKYNLKIEKRKKRLSLKYKNKHKNSVFDSKRFFNFFFVIKNNFSLLELKNNGFSCFSFFNKWMFLKKNIFYRLPLVLYRRKKSFFFRDVYYKVFFNRVIKKKNIFFIYFLNKIKKSFSVSLFKKEFNFVYFKNNIKYIEYVMYYYYSELKFIFFYFEVIKKFFFSTCQFFVSIDNLLNLLLNKDFILNIFFYSVYNNNFKMESFVKSNVFLLKTEKIFNYYNIVDKYCNLFSSVKFEYNLYISFYLFYNYLNNYVFLYNLCFKIRFFNNLNLIYKILKNNCKKRNFFFNSSNYLFNKLFFFNKISFYNSSICNKICLFVKKSIIGRNSSYNLIDWFRLRNINLRFKKLLLYYFFFDSVMLLKGYSSYKLRRRSFVFEFRFKFFLLCSYIIDNIYLFFLFCRKSNNYKIYFFPVVYSNYFSYRNRYINLYLCYFFFFRLNIAYKKLKYYKYDDLFDYFLFYKRFVEFKQNFVLFVKTRELFVYFSNIMSGFFYWSLALFFELLFNNSKMSFFFISYKMVCNYILKFNFIFNVSNMYFNNFIGGFLLKRDNFFSISKSRVFFSIKVKVIDFEVYNNIMGYCYIMKNIVFILNSVPSYLIMDYELNSGLISYYPLIGEIPFYNKIDLKSLSNMFKSMSRY